jgi:hypothetical protein
MTFSASVFRYSLKIALLIRKNETLLGIIAWNQGAMTIDEKIRLGLITLSVVSSVIVASHFGVVPHIKIPFLDELGGTGSY